MSVETQGSDVSQQSATALEMGDDSQNNDWSAFDFTEETIDESSTETATEDDLDEDEIIAPLEATEETEESAETPEEKPVDKKADRVNKFKELETKATEAEAQVTTLTTERDELQAKVEKYDETVARYGGLDKFLELEENFIGKLLDPTKAGEAAAELSTLPHGAAIRSHIMFDSIGLNLDGSPKNLDATGLEIAAENQAVVFNSLLKGYHGIEPNLTADQFEKLGEYLAFQFENRSDKFLSEIDDHLTTFVDPRDRELRELRAKVNEKPASKESLQEQTETDPFADAMRVATEIQTFHAETEKAVLFTPEAKDKPALAEKYRLNQDDKLPKPINQANQVIVEMIGAYLEKKMRNTDAQTAVANFLKNGAKAHPTFGVAANPYKNSVKAQAEQILRTISPRLNGTVATKQPPAPPAAKPGLPTTTDTKTNITTPGNSNKAASWDEFPSGGNY